MSMTFLKMTVLCTARQKRVTVKGRGRGRGQLIDADRPTDSDNEGGEPGKTEDEFLYFHDEELE